MLTEFDDLVRRRNELRAWWALGRKQVGYGDGRHVLRVDVRPPSMVAFCGQAHAGAKNYHDAPRFFVESVRKEMQEQARHLANTAYEKELSRLNAAIEKHRTAVLKQLDQANSE